MSEHVAKVLAAREPDNVRGWLARLCDAIAGEPVLDGETIDDLVSRGRPRWGVRSGDDAAAYVAFWADLTRRHDDPRLAAAYADVLHLLGGPERACEALGAFLTAVRREPRLFIEYAGDFSELAERCGPEAALDFELAKVAYYARRVDHGEMDVEELQDAVHDVLARYANAPRVRERVGERIASSGSGHIARK
jgi:hypothetical protein